MKEVGWVTKPFLTSLLLGIGGFLYGYYALAFIYLLPADFLKHTANLTYTSVATLVSSRPVWLSSLS